MLSLLLVSYYDGAAQIQQESQRQSVSVAAVLETLLSYCLSILTDGSFTGL